MSFRRRRTEIDWNSLSDCSPGNDFISRGQISELAIVTRRGFGPVGAQLAETDRHKREADERSRRLDERIDKVLIDIREFTRYQGSPRA